MKQRVPNSRGRFPHEGQYLMASAIFSMMMFANTMNLSIGGAG
jgi:hypothetical protein